ncbi:sugar kinase [Tessaracoccus sp. T2.5-30]|nr:sugar kinase [Tessaracoccus sp. T2.5-30]VEP40268.1 N-acetylglucosamine repressor [Tessaracoccus lapidicaptus]
MDPNLLPHTVTEQVRTLATVLALVREDRARTRPEIGRQSGLARNVVADRVDQLIHAGLLAEGELGASTGGRAPRELRFRADAGYVLVAEIGATVCGVGIADLSGQLVSTLEAPVDVKVGPVPTLEYVSSLLDGLLGDISTESIWGVGIGLPGPVEWMTGRPVAPPIMPGWDGFDVRGFFASRYGCAVWVDNDVNAMATGEARAGVAQGHQDVIYVKVGTGIGSGLFSRGQIHRGAQGAAGDIGHLALGARKNVVCRCGNTGCLEALAGGGALVRDALAAAEDPRSTYLRREHQSGRPLNVNVIVEAALFGDPVALEMLSSSAMAVGEALAGMVNIFNPSMIVIGGSVGRSLDMYLATIRRAVLDRSLPLATRSLQIVTSPLGDRAGLIGLAFTVIDELLSPEALSTWLERGTPTGLTQLTA